MNTPRSTDIETKDIAPGPAKILRLPGAVTINTVESLADDLRQDTFTPPVLILDASQTEIITTPGIQLLLALAKTLDKDGVALTITQARPAFNEAFEHLGLTSRLTEWEASKWLKQS